MGMNVEKLNVIMKVTDECNLRCIYCYNSPLKYRTKIMDLELIEILLQKIAGDYKEVHFIWHGGEPLLPGIEYYKKIFEIQENYSRKINITNSIQTNATLITDEFAKLLHTKNVSVGVSYDGSINEITRGKSAETLNGISNMKRYEKRVPAIKVVLQEDIGQLISVYQHFNELGIDLKLNYLFNCELQNVKKHYTAEEYANAMEKLFIYWINDKNCRIHLQPFEYYLAMNHALPNRECTNASCLLTFLSMDCDGNLFPCSRFYGEEYCYGNVKMIEKLNDVYNSKALVNILTPLVLRRQKCMEMCELYKYCQGGCCYDVLLNTSEKSSEDFLCVTFKRIYKFIQQYLTYGEVSNPMLDIFKKSSFKKLNGC